MTIVIVTFATIALMVSVNALYVAGEFSTVASRKTRVSQLAASGNTLARQLLPFLEDSYALDRYVAACQLGITLSSLVLGAYGQNALSGYLVQPIESFVEFLNGLGLNLGLMSDAAAQSISATIILILLTILQVIVGELLPKSISIQYPEQVAMTVIWPVKWSVTLFRPLIWLFNGSANLLLRLLNVEHRDSHAHVHSPEEIEILVSESHEGGLLDDEERQMLRNAFRMRDLTAREVMVHRTRIVAAPDDSGVETLLNLALDAGHTRIPLYRDTIDNIIGFVHIKDLFRLYIGEDQNLATILRQVVHVPETLPVIDAWQTLSEQRQYMAIVFDEYGGTAGLLTLEDLIEEIFGEVQDEFDNEMALMTFDQEGRRVHLRADLLVSDVNEYLDLSLPDDDAVTLSGLVLNKLGRIAEVGDEAVFDETTIRVESMEDLGVAEVSLQMDQNAVFPHVDEWETSAND
ncbi:MAG: HlyC/CorC family transporter [Ardenticatenaceae bacterium]|nr:HlyC/CorC family transporter [Anaerolineales bacterium]MCB8917987.1 HlyC/CorC family transporter [Ardenticatenaceae bacterium]